MTQSARTVKPALSERAHGEIRRRLLNGLCGYAIERVTELTGSRWLGAAIPVLVFGAVHAPFWGIGHAVVAGASGLWLTLIYLKTRNLWTAVVAHALLDGIAFAGTDYLTAIGATS